MPKNIACVYFIPYQPTVAYKITNFEHVAFGSIRFHTCWHLYRVYWADGHEYAQDLLDTFDSDAEALARANDLAAELPF